LGGVAHKDIQGILEIAAKGFIGSEATVAVITFQLPILSSRAVPQLVAFFRDEIGDVHAWEVPDMNARITYDD